MHDSVDDGNGFEVWGTVFGGVLFNCSKYKQVIKNVIDYSPRTLV